MTSKEARQQIDTCENKIVGTYSHLLDTARGMGSSAVQAAESKTTGNTFAPLLISVFGVILFIAEHPVWGLLLIAAGIIIAYNVHSSAAGVQQKIEGQQKNLFSTIENNSKI